MPIRLGVVASFGWVLSCYLDGTGIRVFPLGAKKQNSFYVINYLSKIKFLSNPEIHVVLAEPRTKTKLKKVPLEPNPDIPSSQQLA